MDGWFVNTNETFHVPDIERILAFQECVQNQLPLEIVEYICKELYLSYKVCRQCKTAKLSETFCTIYHCSLECCSKSCGTTFFGSSNYFIENEIANAKINIL